MRTTLDIDDDVLSAAKNIAHRSRRTTGDVLLELARQALTGSMELATTVAQTQAFCGFRPLPAGDRMVSEETVKKLRTQEGI